MSRIITCSPKVFDVLLAAGLLVPTAAGQGPNPVAYDTYGFDVGDDTGSIACVLRHGQSVSITPNVSTEAYEYLRGLEHETAPEAPPEQ